MNEVQSLAKFGTDIHGFKNPIYFSSFWGQGQSILYAWIVVPFIKLFGFNVLSFRLPFVCLMLGVIFCLWFITRHNWKLSLCIITSFVLSPWIFQSTRWVLDCNTAPIFFIFGLCALWGMTKYQKQTKQRYILLIISSILFSLCAYGYVLAWFYLPLIFLSLLVFNYFKKLFSWQEILIAASLMFIFTLPLMIFAIRTHIMHVTDTMKFLWFDIPYLTDTRASSFIDFHAANLWKEIFNNTFEVFKIYLNGSDCWDWDSIAPYGVILPLMLPLTFLGFITPQKLLGKHLYLFKQFLLIAFIVHLPLIFILKPMYYHFTFFNLLLVIFTGFGLFYAFNLIGKPTYILLFIALLNFTLFTKDYFNYNRGQLFHYEEGQKLFSSVDLKKNKLYWSRNIGSVVTNAPKFKLSVSPISAKQYEQYLGYTKEETLDNNKMSNISHYGPLYDDTWLSEAQPGDYFAVTVDDPILSQINSEQWEYQNSYNYQGSIVSIYKLKG